MKPKKVYFEIVGFEGRCFTKSTCDWHLINVYVNPTDDGEGYQYNIEGKLDKFAWCDYTKAKCVLSSDLPDEMWYSIKHGSNDFKYPAKEGEDDLEKEDIDINQLVYDKIEPKHVRLYNEAKKATKEIHTIEHLNAFLPKIRDAKYLPIEFVHKAIKLQEAAKPKPSKYEVINQIETE